ncbi:hypothetical protein ACJ6WD_11125 [Streptomyces sp. VTCC 41912]|uniref:hypothetical protein n=1 Tax=Streptomyces TaxID=1883 RepID=UPI00344DB338
MQRVDTGQLWLDKASKGERVVYIQSVTQNFGGYANCISYNFAKKSRRYTQIKLAGFHNQFRCLAT